ncbi:MAG: HemK2/MTQ2 family protein methyltransferase [Halobacteriaceae archaeon]
MTDLAEQRDLETTVYQPAEDSHLLARAATDRFGPGDCVLDVGCGSGIVAAAMADAGADVVATDLNPHACRSAADRGLPAVRADLVTPFASQAVDGVVCNPPYLPADPLAERDDWMEVALTGGADGRAVIDRFVETVGRVLRPDGVALLLVSTLAGVDEVAEHAGAEGFSLAVVAEESYPFETLTVLALVR